MSSGPTILIVDDSTESRDVLRTLFERCGATTIETSLPEAAVSLAEVHRPHLILVDADSDRMRRSTALDDLQLTAARSDTPVVILGTSSQLSGQSPSGQIVAKPYHYGPLIRKIEDLLAAA